MIKGLINPGNLAWSVGASLLQTIFDGGLKGGELEAAKGAQEELIADYRKAVISSFSDVETSLNAVAHLAQQEDYLTQEVNAASEAFRISEIQYREGVADLLAVLQSQQVLFTAQDQLIQIKLARAQADVGLYKALGGGWSEADVDATIDEVRALARGIYPPLLARTGLRDALRSASRGAGLPNNR